ncbi:hypothetical protein, partial [Klebsiella pneumoniae]|uniref:hypothetical protein n=1 Tax=Klebsiella pneumoniae TaxID=573 RepID=UPI001B3C17E0
MAPEVSSPAALRLPGREWDSAERFAKKHPPPLNRKAGVKKKTPNNIKKIKPPKNMQDKNTT